MSTLDESIGEWCHNIGVKLLRNEELESLIDPMLRICNGSNEEIRNPLFQVLNCEDLLLSILKSSKCSEILKNKTTLCVVILKSLLSLFRQKDWRIIISILKIILESDYKEKNTVIQDIWNVPELCRMPAEVVLIIIKYKPALVEQQLCNLYCMARKNEDVCQSDHFQCWAFWCSKSAELFLIVSSIFNQFLIYLNANSVILKIVNKFITNIMAECELNKQNILSLYPIEYQSFVALLMIEPDFNPYKNTIIKKIIGVKNVDSEALLLLLSHFPLWMNVLSNF
nr:uncharacterized protein LOC106692675 [Halyomorpha halys]